MICGYALFSTAFGGAGLTASFLAPYLACYITFEIGVLIAGATVFLDTAGIAFGAGVITGFGSAAFIGSFFAKIGAVLTGAGGGCA